MSEGTIWRLYSMEMVDIVVTSIFAGAIFTIPITRIIMLIKERRK